MFWLQIGVSNLVGLSVGSIEVDQIEKVKANIISFGERSSKI